MCHCIDITQVYLQAKKAVEIWQRGWSGLLCACFANNHWRISGTGGNSVLRYYGRNIVDNSYDNSSPSVSQNISAGEARITSGQRNALESANKSSYGFFIPQV